MSTRETHMHITQATTNVNMNAIESFHSQPTTYLLHNIHTLVWLMVSTPLSLSLSCQARMTTCRISMTFLRILGMIALTVYVSRGSENSYSASLPETHDAALA